MTSLIDELIASYDSPSTIEDLIVAAYGNSCAHGFWEDFDTTYETLKDFDPTEKLSSKYVLDIKLSKIDLMHSELGEMTEGVRKPTPDQHCPEFTSEEIELADCIIRAFDYAGAFDLRLAEAIEAKMAYNKSRPYKHNKGA